MSGVPEVNNSLGIRQGTRISDRYVVVRSLGEGGMGQVFQVEHEALGRHFALKILNINPCSDETLRRFHREARALGRMTTPYVAQVTDFGYEQGLGPFYVMELLDGETLEDRLEREHYLPTHQALPLAIELCQALGEVHSTGFIHRDLKPSNIGLSRSGPFCIKLLDFGLAAAADEGMLDRITRSQEVVGSLPYMAPERFHNAPLTVSVDLYALGVVLYEMLTGRLPYMGKSAAILIAQHLNDPPPPFSVVAPELRLPPSVEAIVARLLDKDPGQRFETASACARALQAASMDAPSPTVADNSNAAATAPTVLATQEDLHEAQEQYMQSNAATLPSQHPPGNRPSAPTGAASAIPTSVVPKEVAEAYGYLPQTDADMGMPVSQPQAGKGWVSGTIPPTTFEPEPSQDHDGPERVWIKIAAILSGGIVGAGIVGALSFMIFWEDPEGESPEHFQQQSLPQLEKQQPPQVEQQIPHDSGPQKTSGFTGQKSSDIWSHSPQTTDGGPTAGSATSDADLSVAKSPPGNLRGLPDFTKAPINHVKKRGRNWKRRKNWSGKRRRQRQWQGEVITTP